MPRPHRPTIAAALLAAALLAAPAGAEGPLPRFEQLAALPGSGEAKFPHPAVAGGQIYIAANSGRTDASLWSGPASQAAFASPERLGAAEGQPDYSTASIAAAADGALHYVWVNQPERAIYHRSRRPGGAWGPASSVVRGSPFPVLPEVAAAPDGTIFVLWRDPDRPFSFSRSTDGGRSWSPPRRLSEHASFNAPAVAAGPGATVVAATVADGDRLQVFAGLWDGAGFGLRRLSEPWGDYADPSIAVAPDGRAAAAWRGVAEAGGSSGAFVAERRADGSWPARRLAAGKVIGRVSLSYDEAGGLHAIWIAEVAGASRLWYAYQPAGGAWSGPVAATGAGAIFNALSAAGRGPDGQLYAHAASERFIGDRVSALAYRFAAGGAAAPFARPVLAGGAALTGADAVALTLHEVRGDPDEMRWRWGAPPAAAEPWLPFSAAQTLTLPEGAGVASCARLSLFSQVRGAGGAQDPALAAQITVDRGVQASLTHLSDSAPGYVREPLARLRIDGTADCGGLASAQAGAGPAEAVAGGLAELTAELPAVEGAHRVAIALTDRLGNQGRLTATLIYDATAPTLTAAALEVRANPDATALHSLTLRGRYEDAGAPLPWAAAVAVSRLPVAPDSPELAWVVVPLSPGALTQGADGALRVRVELSLAALLPAEERTAGAYHYQLRLVDPAGNRSAGLATGAASIEQISYPRLALPLLRK